MTAARGVRNRNPGNIVVSGWTQRQAGYTGPEPEGRFATFASMAHGTAALMRLLLVYRDQHRLKTVRGIIDRWAPPAENDTSSYSLAVAKALGVGVDDELPADAETYTRLARAIVGHENGRDAAAAVTDEDYAEAAQIVFMQAPVAEPGVGSPPLPPPATPPTRPAPAPITERITMPAFLSPFVVAALPALIKWAGTAAPALIRLFGKDGERADKHAKAVEAVMGAAMAATGQTTVEGTVKALEDDTKAQAAYQAALLDDLDRIMGIVARGEELDEASRDRAAERAKGEAWDSLPYLVQRTEWVMYAALAVTSAALVAAFAFDIKDAYTGMIATLFVSTITTVVAEWRRPREYRMGSSAGSKASGDAVRAIAEARK